MVDLRRSLLRVKVGVAPGAGRVLSGPGQGCTETGARNSCFWTGCFQPGERSWEREGYFLLVFWALADRWSAVCSGSPQAWSWADGSVTPSSSVCLGDGLAALWQVNEELLLPSCVWALGQPGLSCAGWSKQAAPARHNAAAQGGWAQCVGGSYPTGAVPSSVKWVEESWRRSRRGEA